MLSLSVWLVACSQPSANQNESTDEALFNYWPSQGQAQIVYQVITQTDDAYQVQFPEITNLEPTHPVAQAINQSSADVIATFKQEADLFFNDTDQGLSSTSIPWDYSLEWLGGRYHPELWSLAVQVYSYQGGAHGNHFTQTYNYHPSRNEILSLNDFFTSEEYVPTLDENIRAQLITAKTERWASSGQEDDYDASLDTFLLDTDFNSKTLFSWVVAERNQAAGILFFFAPYDVGAYAEGSFEAFVPISTLSQWLKPEFQNVFE